MNTSLPIFRKRDVLVEAVKNNRVVIVVADTGGGKSTQFVQYLLAENYKVLCTQPRVLATRTVSERVAFEYRCKLGETIGYQTRTERKAGKDTDCLFVTDGLALKLLRSDAYQDHLLVIDEVHERNLRIDVLMALAKLRLQTDPNFKLVLMSATMDAERLSEYFDGAPIISVPGRLYPVQELQPGISMEDDVAMLVRQKRNVLVFQPGKNEIESFIRNLNALGVDARILPLHGQLSGEDQAKCFVPDPDKPSVIVSTNVAQTSVTIDYIDAVVDSGMERRQELVNGVGGLHLLPISQADSKQRKGRAGRTKEGFYTDHCPVPWDERPEFPVAEILRIKLDQAVMDLADAGIDMEELPFFQQPKTAEIQASKRTLRLLGFLDQSGSVTDSGRLIANLPIDVQFARMILEADRWGVVDDVITIAAILQQGGLTAKICGLCKSNGKRSCSCWRLLAPEETTSDILAQLAVYQYAEGMDKPTMISYGIFAKAFFEARLLRKQLERALKGKVTSGTNGKRENILRAITAGMVEHVYVRYSEGYFNDEVTPREINNQSVVKNGQLIVGQPWDLGNGNRVRRLIRTATVIDLSILTDVAAHLCDIRLARSDQAEDVYLLGQPIGTREVSYPDPFEAEWQQFEIRQLRDRANDLLLQHVEQLSDELYDRLTALDDEDSHNPGLASQLEQWIADAQSMIAQTSQPRFTGR